MPSTSRFIPLGSIPEEDLDYEDTPSEAITEPDAEGIEHDRTRQPDNEMGIASVNAKAPSTKLALRQQLALAREGAARENSEIRQSKKLDRVDRAAKKGESIDGRGIFGRLDVMNVLGDYRAFDSCPLCPNKIEGLLHTSSCGHKFHFRCQYEFLLTSLMDVGVSPVPGCHVCKRPLDWTFFDCQMARIQAGDDYDQDKTSWKSLPMLGSFGLRRRPCGIRKPSGLKHNKNIKG
ncbi:MAG: hypothetical protein M1812_007797 [Candelaria pacifica]|nr:MAG: hypothetical protein M1812_007797 [Candelaria pacifica]